MTSIFTKYTELDPALEAAQIEAAHGGPVFDRWSFLDEALFNRQAAAALGVTLDVAASLDPRRARAELETFGGGDDAPDWVPINAKIFIDLVNNRAWTEADGLVVVDTLLGADANTVNGWATSGYDPADLTSDGLVPLTHGVGDPTLVAFIGSARTKILDAATVRYRYKQVGDGQAVLFVAMSANGVDAIELDANNSTLTVDAGSYSQASLEFGNDISNIVNTGVGSINAVALTITSNRFDITANGSAPVPASLVDGDRPAANPFVATALDVGNNGSNALQSITIYDPLPNTTGLSALSETGVTNTAPHDITFNPELLTFAAPVNASDIQNGINNISATDDEGNPMTFTVVDGPFDIIGGSFTNLEALDVGDTPFTIRATDPGGLYVEQTFTITVTA